MNTDREEASMPTAHHLITGATGTWKTSAVHQHLAADLATPNVQPWVIGAYWGAPAEYADRVHRYADTLDGARGLLAAVLAEAVDRGNRLGIDRITSFEAGDPRHGLPLIVVTVEETATVLADDTCRLMVEHTLRLAAKVGIRFRMTTADAPCLGAFGGSEAIRTQLVAGEVTALPKTFVTA